MIHPSDFVNTVHEKTGTKNSPKRIICKMDNNNKLLVFYFIGISMVLTNIVPFFTASIETVRRVNELSRDWQMIYFYTTSFILSVPLVFEFCLDTVVGKLYPSYNANIVEHKTGHFLILLSLAAPLLLAVGGISSDTSADISNPLFEKCFIDACQCLAFVATFGTMQITDKATWKFSNSLLVLSLYFGSRITMNFSIQPDESAQSSKDCHLGVVPSSISLALILLALIAHAVESRRFLFSAYSFVIDKLKGADWQNGSINSDQFTSAILVTMLLFYLLIRSVLTTYYVVSLSHGFNIPRATAAALLSNVVFALGAVALPGRMIRRGMVVMKHEMESKKTYIRYISHEIRSPLSTTSLGLDYLIDQMSAASSNGRSLDPETILEVVKDTRVSCELATNTLNDLLMFDKIETGMLELSAVECDAWEFVTSCVKPFHLQAQCAGVAIHTTQLLTSPAPAAAVEGSEYPASCIDLEAQTNSCSVDTRAAAPTTLVQVDRYKMEQVVRNFLTNALKFTPQHCHGSIAVNMSVLPTFTVDTLSDRKSESATSPKGNSGRQSSNRQNKQSSRLSGRQNKYKASSPSSAGSRSAAAMNIAAASASAAGDEEQEEFGEDAVLRVELVDVGPGISAENLPKLFGQYVQFDADTLQGGKGSGLGLWLSKAIVEMHGGVIGASSLGAGQGCTFYFELPCRVLQHQQQRFNFAGDGDAIASIPTTRKLGGKSIQSTELTTDESYLRSELSSAQSISQRLPPGIAMPSPVLIPQLPPTQQHMSSVHKSPAIPTITSNTNSNRKDDENHREISKCDTITFHLSSSSAPAHPSARPSSPKNHVHSRQAHKQVRSVLSASSGSISSGSGTKSGGAEKGSIRSVRSHHSHNTSVSVRSKATSITPQQQLPHHSVSLPDVQHILVGLRVLLVDDSALARKMVERSLLTAQCSVHHAQNGLEGVQKVQQSLQPGETPYDVVVIDCYMPVMNGPEAVAIMRGSNCGFKGLIFAVTGAATNEEFTVGGGSSAELGVDCVMVKPFNLDTFRKTVFDKMSGAVDC